MQSKMITELENTKYNFEKKLRESKEEADQWKTQLDMMAADDAKQRQRLSEEVPQLQGENRQLKSRYSIYMPTKRSDAQLLVEREKQFECCPVEIWPLQ